MNNAEVIEVLKGIIRQLEMRIDELNKLRPGTDVPFNQRPIMQNQIMQRTSSINLRILDLERQLSNRALMESLGATVTPLDASRVDKLNTALTNVSKDISRTRTFQAAMALASKISDAASGAANAAEP